ncbi:MAG: histidinol-phosphate transaminase [Lachnospiraceae bacterium]|nr:histidinol-phosphate transaminase [Lachnospiraceae bacterium]
MSWEDKVRKVEPYVPGEQPDAKDMIKLNTNECPYPPAPAVKDCLWSMDYDRMRLYPNPDVLPLRKALAQYHGLDTEQVFVGVGSDDVIDMAFLTFFNSDIPVLFPEISYSFYKVWAELYRIPYATKPLDKDFHIVPADYKNANGGIIFPNPNAPTGVLESVDTVEEIIAANPDSVVMIDEAYVDFAGEGASVLPLIDRYENLLVIRTFSKSRAMAGARIGYCMGSRKLISCLEAVKFSVNSYTMNTPAIEMGVVSVKDDAYFKEIIGRIVNTRERMKKELKALGFSMPDGKGNFVFAKHEKIPAKKIYTALRERNIFVRFFDTPLLNDRLRITVGTDEEADRLMAALKEIVEGA